jgi:hypothetical protein
MSILIRCRQLIEVEGTKAVAEAFKVSSTLQAIYLLANRIGKEKDVTFEIVERLNEILRSNN